MTPIVLHDAPEGLYAVYGDPEDEEAQYELPIVKLAVNELGEITGVVWCQRLQRFAPDCSDKTFFPDFLRVEMIGGDDDTEEEDEPSLDD